MIDINDLKQKLVSGEVVVNFTKVNGESRRMPCTLNESQIPSECLPKTSKQKSDDVVSVWCIDKHAWRSFRVDSITSYETL